MSGIVCIDTHVIVWGIKEQAQAGQENMIPIAKAFLEWLDENKKKVIIPVPIITELLVPVPNGEHEAFLQVIHEKFRVVPVDEVAAIKCAEIWNSKKDDEELRKYREQHEIPREKMKFDFQIAATAIVRKAECIYSNDPHLRKFAGDVIMVKEIPNLANQMKLEL